MVTALLIVAFACFCASAAGVSSKVNLQATGLAAWVLIQLMGALGR